MKNGKMPAAALLVGIAMGAAVGYVLPRPGKTPDYRVAYLIEQVVVDEDVLLANGGVQMYVDSVELYQLSPTNIDVGNARHLTDRLTVLPDAQITFFTYDPVTDQPHQPRAILGKDLRSAWLKDSTQFTEPKIFSLTRNAAGDVIKMEEEAVELP